MRMGRRLQLPMGVTFAAAHGGDVFKTSRSTLTYPRVHYNICVVYQARRMEIKPSIFTYERVVIKRSTKNSP